MFVVVEHNKVHLFFTQRETVSIPRDQSGQEHWVRGISKIWKKIHSKNVFIIKINLYLLNNFV